MTQSEVYSQKKLIFTSIIVGMKLFVIVNQRNQLLLR